MDGYIDKNPVPAVKLPKAASAASTEREVFTFDEIPRLVKAAPDKDWQTLILLGAFTIYRRPSGRLPSAHLGQPDSRAQGPALPSSVRPKRTRTSCSQSMLTS